MTTIYNADCMTILKDIPDESIDMVMTSPPYDNLRTYNGAIDQWNFDKFKAIAKEIARILVRGGGMCMGGQRCHNQRKRDRNKFPTGSLLQG